MIDTAKLVKWYDMQAPLYRLWRDNYDGSLVRGVEALLRGGSPVRSILDAGCGTGMFCIGLARRCDTWRVVGIDASPGMIRVARRQAAKRRLRNLSLSEGDVNALPYDDAGFDAVVAGGLFPNLNDPEPPLREFARVLAPGGRVVVVEFDREAMPFATRVFFRLMIFGYRVFSGAFRRFRFADGWNIETSTIHRPSFEATLVEAGFRIVTVFRQAGHLIYHLEKGAPECRGS
jgi:ubiquinone/menaquinone biosynthesis C-methylase UbiE